MQAGLWAGVSVCVLLALLSGWQDRRRLRRHDPDAIGIIDWPTVLVFSLIGAAILTTLALNA
ncbi:MAG: hypothetical protein B7Y45_09550 [Sphingomonas sp. 28-66-16]|nr:MAG: hypothetical protein B7Y45_09550 [Sphingomonas sp. 28-66-16]